MSINLRKRENPQNDFQTRDSLYRISRTIWMGYSVTICFRTYSTTNLMLYRYLSKILLTKTGNMNRISIKCICIIYNMSD